MNPCVCVTVYFISVSFFFREWLETLRVVRSMSAEKIKRIMEREVDPRNALGSIDLDNIDQVVAMDQTKRYKTIGNYKGCVIFYLQSQCFCHHHS